MLLSQSSTYAIRAAIHLAEQGDELPISVGEIAAALGAPRNYLSKILHQLARAGVLISQPGPRGGFRLAAPPEQTGIAEIVLAAEPHRTPDRRCLLGRPECSDADPCAVHQRWQPLADRIVDFLNETTLADLRRRPRKTKSVRARPRKSAAGKRKSQEGKT